MRELLVEERDGVRIERRDLRPGVNIFTTKMKRFLIFFSKLKDNLLLKLLNTESNFLFYSYHITKYRYC